MTRNFFLSLIVFLFIMQIKAQCKDYFTKNDSWKFAAGVTLYSNTDYNGGFIDLTYRPLEFNLRYKVGNNHVIRMSFPIVNKENLSGSILYHPSYDGKESLVDFYKLMLSEYAREYYHMLEFNYNLYGITLGYDYNYSITPTFSAFAGVDLAYYYTQRNFDYYGITYLKPIDNASKIFYMEDIQGNDHFNEYAIKPLVGIRYQYQKLLFEASIGFLFFDYKYTVIKESNKFYPDENISNQNNEKLTIPSIGIQQQFVSQLSLYYTF